MTLNRYSKIGDTLVSLYIEGRLINLLLPPHLEEMAATLVGMSMCISYFTESSPARARDS